MGKEISNNLGKIEISEEVIATIAGVAAVECYGLVGMASRKLSDGFVELLGRESLSKGVQVKVEENQVTIDLFIIVGYGIRISEVANNVIDKVRFTVENMTGLPVTTVNVNVEGVRIPK
ncbi:MAG TPA: Asp23/Gls24 family envelope stress response protein [Desulfobacteria bacterium]|nr:Asp23/Gls24 family envelope stress response protein [Desulfobacteria bacterium]